MTTAARVAQLRAWALDGCALNEKEVADIFEALDTAYAALRAVRDHHVKLNQERGRPLQDSQTIRFCNAGLGEI